MNVFERANKRAQSIETQRNNFELDETEVMVGTQLAKHVKAMTRKDSIERYFGRLKVGSIIGAIGLLGAKITSEVVGMGTDALSGNLGVSESFSLPEFNGTWITPAAMGLMGLAGALRAGQNMSHKGALAARTACISDMEAAGFVSLGVGAVETANTLHEISTPSRELVGVFHETTPKPPMETMVHEFLYFSEPKISQPQQN